MSARSKHDHATDPSALPSWQITPGPWIVTQDQADNLIVCIDDDGPGRCVLATVEDQPEAEANAQLIAAAPELLRAAEQLRDGCAALMRAVAQAGEEGGDIVEIWAAELARLRIPEGFGANAQDVIAKAGGTR